jgi:hypothetical protein
LSFWRIISIRSHGAEEILEQVSVHVDSKAEALKERGKRDDPARRRAISLWFVRNLCRTPLLSTAGVHFPLVFTV